MKSAIQSFVSFLFLVQVSLIGVILVGQQAQAQCDNPIDPLTAQSLNTNLSLNIQSGFVNFTVSLPIETDSGLNTVLTTYISFENSACGWNVGSTSIPITDIPDLTNCLDDYTATNWPFATLQSCLSLSCVDSNNADVANCDPANCLSPPCSRQYSSTLNVTRQYNFTAGRETSLRTLTSEHSVAISTAWISTASLSGLQLDGLPNVIADAIISSVFYNNSEDSWTITVETTILYPWQLTTGALPTIGGIAYTVSSCESVPTTSGEVCTQTITFKSDNCLSLSTIFGGISSQFTNLEYSCVITAGTECPIGLTDTRPAILNITLNGPATSCSTIDIDLSIDPQNITLATYDNDFSTPRNAFLQADSVYGFINFKLYVHISQTLVVTLLNLFEDGNSLHWSNETAADDCAQNNVLCWIIDTGVNSNQLPNVSSLVDQVGVVLNFTAVIEVTFPGSKKREIEIKNNIDQALKQLQASTAIQLLPNEASVSPPIESSASVLYYAHPVIVALSIYFYSAL